MHRAIRHPLLLLVVIVGSLLSRDSLVLLRTAADLLVLEQRVECRDVGRGESNIPWRPRNPHQRRHRPRVHQGRSGVGLRRGVGGTIANSLSLGTSATTGSDWAIGAGAPSSPALRPTILLLVVERCRSFFFHDTAQSRLLLVLFFFSCSSSANVATVDLSRSTPSVVVLIR